MSEGLGWTKGACRSGWDGPAPVPTPELHCGHIATSSKPSLMLCLNPAHLLPSGATGGVAAASALLGEVMPAALGAQLEQWLAELEGSGDDSITAEAAELRCVRRGCSRVAGAAGVGLPPPALVTTACCATGSFPTASDASRAAQRLSVPTPQRIPTTNRPSINPKLLQLLSLYFSYEFKLRSAHPNN